MQRSITHKSTNGAKLKVGIVVGRFNEEITNGLLAEAKALLTKSGVVEKNIAVVDVPGSAEIPFALQRLAVTKKFDCLIALGCIIRGETPHFDYVCAMAQQGILRASLDYRLPIGFGIITATTEEQARARFNLGAQAAAAAVELATKAYPR